MEAAQPSVPTYDLKCIVESLNSMGFKITVKELKNINIDTLITIFKGFLEMCITISPSLFDVEPSDAVLHFDSETLKQQSDSFKLLQLYMLVKYFLDLCAFNPSFNDAFVPTKKTLVRQLSTMINFARFEFEELTDFSAVQEKNKAFIDECIRLKKESDEYATKNYLLNSKKIEQKKAIDDTRKRIAALKEKIIDVKEKRKKLATYKDINQKELDSIKAEEAQLKLRDTEIQKKRALYDKLLIRSPERLRKELDKNSAQAHEIEKLIYEKKKENDVLSNDLFEREKFVENFQIIKSSLENFFNNDVMNANVKIKEIESLKEQITRLNYTIKHTESSIQVLVAEFEKLNEKNLVQRTKTERELLQLKQKDDNLLQQINELKKQRDELNNELNRLNDEMKKTVENSQRLQDSAFRNIINYSEKSEILKKFSQIKKNHLTNIGKENSLSNEQIGTQLAKMFDFIKEF